MSDVFRLFGSLALRGQEEFEQGLERAEQQGQRTSTALDTAFRRIATSVAAAFSVTAITNFTRQIVQASATISARTAQFNATFKAVSESATEMFNRVSAATNVMAERLQTAGTKAFSQFTGAGLEANEALRYTERYLNLAADAAAYFDISLEDADVRLRSFIRGNVEAGDMIGLFTSETQRNSAALEEYGKKYIECTEAQKQMIMLNIADEIYRQSGAIGQAQREGEAWENTIGNLREAWLQFSGELGKPVMNALIPVVQWFTESLNALRGESTSLDTAFTNLQTALGNYKKAQEDARTATDETTEAMLRQSGQALRRAIQESSDAYTKAISDYEKLAVKQESLGGLVVNPSRIANQQEVVDNLRQNMQEIFNEALGEVDFETGYQKWIENPDLFTRNQLSDLQEMDDLYSKAQESLQSLKTEASDLLKTINDTRMSALRAYEDGTMSLTEIGSVSRDLAAWILDADKAYQQGCKAIEDYGAVTEENAETTKAYLSELNEALLSVENGTTEYVALRTVIDGLTESYNRLASATGKPLINAGESFSVNSLAPVSSISDQSQTGPSVIYSDSDKVLQDLENNINTADRLKLSFNELGIEYDANAAKIRSYRNALEDLASLGFQPGSAAVDDIISKMNELGGSTETFEDKFQNTASKIANGFSTAASYATSFFSSLFDLQNQNWEQQQAQIDEELEAMEEKYEKEREMAEDSYEKESEALLAQLKYGDLTQEEYAEKKKALDDSYEQSKQESLDAEAEAEEELMAKKDEIARKAFDAQKMQQIAQVLIQGATAIMTAFAQLGPIGGAIASAAISATTGVQTATIAAQQYTPMLARGGIVDGPTHIIAGEAGAEAIVPLENNTEWTSAVADLMAPKLDASDKSSADSLREEVRTLRAMLADYLPRILGKSEKIVLDTGALVGATAGAMDTQLGIISRKRARGR